MSFNPDLRIPWGYGTAVKALADVEKALLVHYHPEFVRRLLAWLSSKAGKVGIGGTWRAGGAQPNKPGFAPEGKSFHQDQNFNDGFCGAAAVDLVARNGSNVHRAPTWNEVPAQGSAEAKTWGVHCNVGAPGQVGSEPWHIQPVEIDGWQTWWNQGRPAPRKNYPIPGAAQSPSPAPTPSTGGHVLLYRVAKGDSYWRICEIVHADGKATNARVSALQAANGNRPLHPNDLIVVPGRVA